MSQMMSIQALSIARKGASVFRNREDSLRRSIDDLESQFWAEETN